MKKGRIKMTTGKVVALISNHPQRLAIIRETYSHREFYILKGHCGHHDRNNVCRLWANVGFLESYKDGENVALNCENS
jgi:hypothetical protein